MVPKDVCYYCKPDSSSPFVDWFSCLSVGAQARITSRLHRVATGTLGNVNSVGDGVHELKFKDKGLPAFRIYFGNDGMQLIVLLLGGDKSEQANDIKLAKDYWHDYKQRK